MGLLDDLLESYQPPEWDSSQTYSDRRYARIILLPESEEYRQIESEFRDTYNVTFKIEKIERVQHPYAYFALMIRKEHLKKLHDREPDEKRSLYFTDESLDTILEYNFDRRRNTPMIGPTKYVVLMKSLRDYDDRDTDKYPEYIITLEKPE